MEMLDTVNADKVKKDRAAAEERAKKHRMVTFISRYFGTDAKFLIFA